MRVGNDDGDEERWRLRRDTLRTLVKDDCMEPCVDGLKLWDHRDLETGWAWSMRRSLGRYALAAWMGVSVLCLVVFICVDMRDLNAL